MRASRGATTWLRDVTIAVTTAIVAAVIIRAIAFAGSLTPSASPAATMKTTQQVYDPLATSGYDASSVTASSTGNALQIAKCAITKLQGGSCS